MRHLTSLDLGAALSQAVLVTTAGSCTSNDNVYSLYDDLGHKLFSNENGGVWSRYYYDAQGNVVREVRFRYQDPVTGQFLNTIPQLATAPSQAQLEANLQAALAAAQAGQDTVRDVTRTFDAVGHVTSETHYSQAYGAVTDAVEYDRYGNKTAEISAQGIVGEENRTDYAYDSQDRVVKVTYGASQYFTSGFANASYFRPEETTTYDLFGNKSTVTDVRGNVQRYYFGTGKKLQSEWDAHAVGGASTLRTDYGYDAFGRVVTKTQTDLRSAAQNDPNHIHTTHLGYNNFDEMTEIVDAENFAIQRGYDKGGNLAWEKDANGVYRYFEYDAEKHLTSRTDGNNQVWATTYDAYGHRDVGERSDGPSNHLHLRCFRANAQQARGGRGKYWGFGGRFRLVQTFAGATSYNEQSRHDWLARTTQITDTFGKNDSYEYDDGDRLVRLTRNEGTERPHRWPITVTTTAAIAYTKR